jgi:hypothetical protein
MYSESNNRLYAVMKEILTLIFVLMTLKEERDFPGGTQFFKSVLKEISFKFENRRRTKKSNNTALKQ